MTASLIERFESSIAEVRRAVAGVPIADLTVRTGPGKWSILELVIHLQDSDAIMIDRMKRIIAENNPTLLRADESAYVDRLHCHDQSLDDAIALLELGRRQMARVLRRLPAEAFGRHGTHNVAGRVTLADLISGAVDHVEYHLKFLRDKRQRLGCG